MLQETGKILGTITGVLIILAAFNYVFKYINRKWGKKIRVDEKKGKQLNSLIKFFSKQHVRFGGVAIVIMLAHVIIQYSWYGISITGIIALIVMGLQLMLGLMLKKKNINRKMILKVHRLLPLLLLVVLAFHPV